MTDEYVTPEEHNVGARVACLLEMANPDQRCLLPKDHEGPHMCPQEAVAIKTLGQVAYDAFGAVCYELDSPVMLKAGIERPGYVSDFDEEDPQLKVAWEAAAEAVVAKLTAGLHKVIG